MDIQKLSTQPLKMEHNRVWRPFIGGKLLDAWQGISPAEDGHKPEQWVASTMEARNMNYVQDEGLSKTQLEDGNIIALRDLIGMDPAAFLGKAHVQKHGSSLAVLVKVLDSYSRLMIQVHPDKIFAKNIMNSDFGKTEAWYILGGRKIDGKQPYVLMGFKPGITKEKWKDLYEKQDVEGMINAMHRLDVKAGDIFLIKGGMPHAMGQGCFFLEIQEPTDYTMRVERLSPGGEKLPDTQLHQGVGFDNMFDCFHYDGLDQQELLERCLVKPSIKREESGGKEISLISPKVTSYFSMTKIEVTERMSMPANEAFAVAVVIAGSGKILWDNGEMDIAQSDELFLPAGMNDTTWQSTNGQKLELVVCYPPR